MAIQFDARVLVFPTITPEVLKLHPDLESIFNSFRVALSPDKSNNAFISVRPNKKALFSVSLEKSNQFLAKVKGDYFVTRESKERVKLYKFFPAVNWEGMSWFSREELIAIYKKGYESLLLQNFVHPKDAEPYMGWKDKGLEYCFRTQRIIKSKRKPKCLYNGWPTINLIQAIERLPVGGSVRATTTDMSFDMVKRSYLEYLVYDGTGVGVGMKSAISSIPGTNALRDSILLYLNKTADSNKYLSVRPNGEYAVREGKVYCPTTYKSEPECTRGIRKQWERIDIQEAKDLEWKPFCTFGYYDRDTFVASGLPYHIPFESHGIPTWIKRKGEEGEKSPEHFQSLDEWERNMPWKSEEEVDSFVPFEVPKTFNAQVRWFWNLKKLVTAFEDRWEHHLSLEAVERSPRDLEKYLWNRDELVNEHYKMTWEANQCLKDFPELKKVLVVKQVLKDLKASIKKKPEVVSKDKELAQAIYEWIRYYTFGYKKAQAKDKKLLDWNLKQSKQERTKAKACMSNLAIVRKTTAKAYKIIASPEYASCYQTKTIKGLI